jgi:uncharacterized ion transporter superfamily protein YfcC
MDTKLFRIFMVFLCALALSIPWAYAEKSKPKKGEEASVSTVVEEEEEEEEQEIKITDPSKNEEISRKISVRKKLSELELKLVGPVFSTEM